jgi:hypothetical protein
VPAVALGARETPLGSGSRSVLDRKHLVSIGALHKVWCKKLQSWARNYSYARSDASGYPMDICGSIS